MTNNEKVSDTFKTYLSEISLKMVDEGSSYMQQNKAIEDQFMRLGLSNEQLAQIISEVNGKAMQFVTQYANASAMELIKLDENRELRAVELEIAKKNLELKTVEIDIEKANLKLKAKELEIKIEELAIKKIELEIKGEELAIKKRELDKIEDEILLLQAKTDLTGAQQEEAEASAGLLGNQSDTEEKQALLVAEQSKLVTRQESGYDDNRRVKKSEHLNGLASFAVNSGADGMAGMVSAATSAANEI